MHDLPGRVEEGKGLCKSSESHVGEGGTEQWWGKDEALRIGGTGMLPAARRGAFEPLTSLASVSSFINCTEQVVTFPVLRQVSLVWTSVCALPLLEESDPNDRFSSLQWSLWSLMCFDCLVYARPSEKNSHTVVSKMQSLLSRNLSIQCGEDHAVWEELLAPPGRGMLRESGPEEKLL